MPAADPQSTQRVRVLIADDHRLFAETLEALLATYERIDVVGHAHDGREAVERAPRLEPDVVLMDIKMPPTYAMEGIEAAHVIKAERPRTGIVVLTQHDDEGYVLRVLAYADQGPG